VSDGAYDVLRHTLDGDPRREATLPDLERRPDPWESSMQATCECLSWREVLDNLDRRHAEDELGETTYREFPVHARSAIVTAHRLMDDGAFTEAELRTRMNAIRERLTKV
jgi:hypothetical protein